MAKEKKATPATPRTAKLSRQAAANQVLLELSGTATLSALAAAADALVVGSGGTSRIKGTLWFVKQAVKSAAAFGLVEVQRPTDVLISKKGAM